MKWTWLKNNNILFIIILLLISFIIIDKGFKKINETSPVEEIELIKYNTIIIDSIVYDIQYRDSIIYKIRYKYEEEIIKAESITDSAAIELFKSLCTSDSLYGDSYTN